MDRRRFLRALADYGRGAVSGAVALVAATQLRRGLVNAATAPAGQHPLRPPGALSEDRFRAACTRCFLCAEVCPPQCIRFPSRVVGAEAPIQRGPGGTLRQVMIAPVWDGDDTPYVLPWLKACTACMRCGEVCPTGALTPIAAERDTIKREVRMGVALIDRKICLPWTRRSWCGACLTVCPYRQEAITVDHQSRPTVHAEHCIGCGLCVEVCPIRYKAIAVVPPFYPDRGGVRPE